MLGKSWCAGLGCLELVERPGQAWAGLRGIAGPVIFEEDPDSVACLGFIPPTPLVILFLLYYLSGSKGHIRF